MAQDDNGQSHCDSPSNLTVLAPTSISPSLAPIVASATASQPTVANSATSSAADTTLPSIAAAIAATPSTAADDPTASTTSAALPSASVSTDTDTDAPATCSVPASAAAVPAVPAVPPAVPQQNGDSRASEPTSIPSSNPEMSNQYPGAPHGQPGSYPGHSTPYGSTVGAHTAQYAPYPAVTSQPTETYRPNPMTVGSNVMSLPSMRTIDPVPQQPGPSMGNAQGMQMNMPMAPVQSGMPFYGHHGMAMAPGYGLPSDPMARYALPHDPRLLGHRGPKKCDETHPTCNNCKKSKRECLGYDPIFRQQPGGPSSSNIQPAPSSQLTPPAIPSSVPSSVPSSIASNPALTARTTNSYGSQPSMLPSSYATAHATTASPNPSLTSLSYDSSFSTVASPPIKAESGYEYSSTIDPALQTFAQSSIQDGSRSVDQKPLVDNNLHLRAKKMKIDEIIDLLGAAPPPQQIPQTEEVLNEVTKVYHEMYAPGLSSFFETGWYYFAENGTMSFPRNPRLIDLLASFLKILEAVRANDHTQMAYSGILETRIVWELARSSYQSPDTAPPTGAMTLPRDGDAKEAQNRVRVVEALLCGDYLHTNPLCPPIHDHDPHRTRQFDFWYNLAEFVRTRDNPTLQSTVKAREDVLTRLRYLLDGRENRDVLYSIAVVRELAPHFDAGYGNTVPSHLDESDPKNRLAVASKFILDESQVTGGTTNVVRRFSDIAFRALVNPGVNINRGT
ncbi:hypothetical protein FZEAL_3065 [Fusarium zealandicum]|uniref:Negative acting factor n=1 Tax=Fusarium zealandicum TaxID=1053134 RepID=A0A8H4UQB3_9HYPO|nr:hypothetical protein FZEAL_3065 [Fusarium zealandicum]